MYLQTQRNSLHRAARGALVVCAWLLASCGGNGDDEATTGTSTATQSATVTADTDTTLRALLARNNMVAPARPTSADAVYSLGVNLFQSTLLSGNKKVSCSSCHAIGNAGMDNLALAIGVDGTGGPPSRTGLPVIHRNTPTLMNLGVGHRDSLFWDGRVALVDGVWSTPAGASLPARIDSALAAQSLFPLLARTEMLGAWDSTDSNTLAELNAADAVVENDPLPVWNAIMDRLRADAGMAAMLQLAWPDVPLASMGIEYAANAIAAFEARRWYGFGDTNQLIGYATGTRDLSDAAKRGGLLFFDKARCVSCHSGPLLTDQKFHNLVVPQIGPGFGGGATQDPPRDKGRYEVTHADADLYTFLTPSLWEVKNTFPYLHNGVYATLEDTLRHHLDPVGRSQAFRCAGNTALQSGGNPIACRDSTTAAALYADMAARVAPELAALPALSDSDIADLVAFLNVLTDGNNNSIR